MHLKNLESWYAIIVVSVTYVPAWTIITYWECVVDIVALLPHHYSPVQDGATYLLDFFSFIFEYWQVWRNVIHLYFMPSFLHYLNEYDYWLTAVMDLLIWNGPQQAFPMYFPLLISGPHKVL